MDQKIITYDNAMKIIFNGKYYNAMKNIKCDYCMVSNLEASWKLQPNDDIDLCMNCFITLRNNIANGQKSLPINGSISNIHENNTQNINKINYIERNNNSMTFMMQDSIRPQTKMIQDSVRPRTRMMQDSVRPQTYMMQDSVRPSITNFNNIGSYDKNGSNYSFLDAFPDDNKK